jgi:hypothetical protein
MSDLGSSFNPQAGRPAAPQPGTEGSGWRRFASSFRESLLRNANWKNWVLLALPMLLVVPVLAAIAWFAAKPNPLLKAPSTTGKTTPFSSLLTTADTSKAKPAPGKTYQPPPPPVQSSYVPQTPPAVEPNQPATSDMPIPAQNIAGATAPSTAVPTISSVPTTAARPPITPLVYRAKHDKVFGDSCSGQLTLNSGGLVFSCPDDPHGSVQIALNEIGAVDENGVRLLSGKKYHFSIPGMTKDGEQTLFTNWLHQVR